MLYPLTPHADGQMKRRRIPLRDVDLACEVGMELHRAGAVFYVLRRCDIPPHLADDPRARRAEGTTVVIEHGRISTVYRNPQIGHLKRKKKRTSRPRFDRRAA